MSEYIEKSMALNANFRIDVDLFESRRKTAEKAVQAYAEYISGIPAADVRPVVKAKWADNQVAFYRGCPECGAFVRANLDEVFLRDFPSAVGRLNYCPNCGADMREES